MSKYFIAKLSLKGLLEEVVGDTRLPIKVLLPQFEKHARRDEEPRCQFCFFEKLAKPVIELFFDHFRCLRNHLHGLVVDTAGRQQLISFELIEGSSEALGLNFTIAGVFALDTL